MKIDIETQIEVLDNLLRYHNKDEGMYDVYATIEDFPLYVALGYTYDERLAVFKMLYLNNCTLDDLKNMTLLDLMAYIKETDDYFNNDVEYFNKCIELIKMYEN